jgi:predicted Rdx family selenoprotein
VAKTTQFAQELLSTFSTQIGEVALIPATGGLFTVELTYVPLSQQENQSQDVDIKKVLLWDRKAEGGFPGTHPLSLFSPLRRGQ